MPSDPVDVPAGDAERERAARRAGETDAWGAFGLVVSGVVVWGGLGLLLSAWTGSRLPSLVGLLLGTAGGLYLVWFRYGRAHDAGSGHPGQRR